MEHGFEYTLILDWNKFRAHKCIFAALGIIVLRKFGQSLISQKVEENTLCQGRTHKIFKGGFNFLKTNQYSIVVNLF